LIIVMGRVGHSSALTPLDKANEATATMTFHMIFLRNFF
jgi:hypothetical protein